MAILKSAVFLSLSIIIFGGEAAAASCSQPLATPTCYRHTMRVSYHTVYSRASTVSYHACGWWGWDRCHRTHYSQRSSPISLVHYRYEMYCCSGYIDIGGSCEPECSPTCEAEYTCVAPNTCRRGVQLMLGGVSYPNNSVIQFDSIYYTYDHCHSLLCTTDQVPPCCSSPLNGNWYNVQPNGSFINVPLSTEGNDYYQNRENDGTVRLIRQVDATQSTDSLYCCQLLDATLTNQTLCVTIARYSPGVWLSLDGQLVPNNSAVELREVYETTDNSYAHTLMCVTLKRPCCKTPSHRFGGWFYPNGSEVSIDGSGNSFYRDRDDDGTVRLHRRGIASLSAAMGQYCCKIPNANGVNHTLCAHFIDSSPGVWLMASKDGQVHIYPNNTILSLSEVFGMEYSLLCVTERRPCCSSLSKAGDWYYQNGTAVSSYGQRFAFYTSRGDDGTIRLHIRDNNVSLMNTSQFCCEILNINGLSQKLCIKICDSDCVTMMTETATATTNLTTSVTTHQKNLTTSVGATVGYVVMGLAVVLCITVATAMVLWKYSQQKVKTTQNTATNVEKSSEVEIQYIKHASIEKETEAQGDDRDEINVYENVSDEIHRMSTCPAYDTIKY